MDGRDKLAGGLKLGICLLAAGTSLLGLLVLLGWYTHNTGLIQIRPQFVPMQYNTALGFLLSGVALLALVYRRPRLAGISAVIVGAIGVATLLQYIFAIDLGIDQLLMQHYITTLSSHPGRMAPNTALCFALVGTAIVLSGRWRKWTGQIWAIAGSAVMGLGLIALLGYAIGLEPIYGWGQLTRMAVHTSAGFMLIGSGLLLLSWRAELSGATAAPTWLPIPVGIVALVISLSFWQALDPNQNAGGAEIANILLLIGGIALSFVIAGLVYLAQWARKNQLLAESSLRELVHETDARTKTEQQLKASEDRWQFALEGNRDGVWDWNVKDNEVYFSKCWKNMLGFDEDEISSDLNEWEKRIHPDDKDRVMADVNRHFVGEAPYYENEHRVLCKDGTYKWILDRGTVVARTEDGKPLRMIGTHTDITERKLEQEALAKNIRDLEDQKYVLDHHAIVSRTDIAGRITYVNEKFCEISGYSSEELLGQHHRFINSNFHSAEFFKQLWSTIASGDIWRGEIRNRAKDGSFYWVESTLIPLLDEKGAIQEYVGVRTDITGRKRAEEHLRRTQKLEAIGELTGGIAHDFNNLLGIILGNIKLVGRNADPGSTMQKQLDRVAKAATRGVVLTRRMLKFSQQSPEQHSPLNINEVLESMRDLISKSLTAKVKVEMSLAEDLWMVDIDEGSFEDAMINLSLNARDAMAEGGGLLFETENMSLDRRSVRREESLNPGDYVCLKVKDTGIGMSADILEKIFDPFFTTKDKAGGTGLGLPMVYGFIQRCKGHISVFSEPGKGSTFKIYLPRTENGKSLFKKSKLEQGAAATSLPRGTETILIVDDEKDLTLIAEEILQELGYTAICAGAGDEALRILAENQNIKLLISDIVMPGMSGVALADATTKLYPEIKIILTSGYIGPGEADARAYGAVLVKPYDDSELARRVRESLDGA